MDSPSANTNAHWVESLKARVFSRGGLFVALVFLLAFIVRAHLMRYELFFEFDSYWHARMVSYILQGMSPPAIDPLAYYQNVAAATLGNVPLLFWYISATIYKIFTLNAPYSLELWVLWVKILPAFYGALTCVAMYFLGKEMFKGPYEKATGLFAGILAAVVPSFVYRTMGGFFEDDSLGFLWMVIGFVFFVRATRNPEWNKANIQHAVIAGIGFALMAFTWSAFNILVPILLGIGTVQFLVWLRDNELEKARGYGMLWLVSFGLLAIAATIQTGIFWLDQFGGILGTLFFGTSELVRAPHVMVFLVVFLGLAALLWTLVKRNTIPASLVRNGFAVVVILLAISPLLVGFFNVSLRTGDVLGQTVGEESEGKNFFGNKYNLMALFALIGIPAMGMMLWRRTRDHAVLALPFVWLLVTFFMAWGKLKFTYYWGLPLALTGAIVLVFGIKWMMKRSVSTQKLALLGMGIMLVGSVAAGTFFVTQNVPNIESTPEWKTALFWANENLPADAKFFNWWDEGHWISFLSGRKTLIDNRNADTKATADVALFMLEPDTDKAREIVDKYGSTHLIFGRDLLSKLPSLGFYAYGITNGNDPRIQGLFSNVLECQQVLAPITREKSFACGSNNFTTQQMAAFPTKWQSVPNNLQNGTPLFIYRDADSRRIYAFSQKANETTLVKLWMSEESAMKEFVEVYRNTGDVRIFQKIPIAMVNESTSVPADEPVLVDSNAPI